MKKLMQIIITSAMFLVVLLTNGCAVVDTETAETREVVIHEQQAVGQQCDIVYLTLNGPESVNEGETFLTTLNLKTLDRSAAFVTAHMRIPDGFEYVKSEPKAKRQGSLLSWSFPVMDANETKDIKVWLKAKNKGTYIPCASIMAYPRTCITVKVKKPKISITKTGPEVAALNDIVPFNLVVKNEGDGVAKDVVVIDTVPKGLTHESGKKQLSYKIGDLGPQASKTLSVKLKAAERGRHVNLAKVKTSNAGEAKDDAPVVVKLEDFKVTKTGMKKQYLGKKANYVITVKNTGDTTLDLQVADNAAPETTIVKAQDAIATTSTKATWKISGLKPGASEEFKVVLTSRTPGVHKNCATVSSKTASKTDCQDTLWEGFAAILFEVIDTEDPLQVSEKTTYIIRVTNQGTKHDNNIVVTANFPKEIKPLAASGDSKGKIVGQNVTFEPYKVLNAKKSITLKIEAQGAVIGDGRVKFNLTSDLIKKPVVEEESTHVY